MYSLAKLIGGSLNILFFLEDRVNKSPKLKAKFFSNIVDNFN